MLIACRKYELTTLHIQICEEINVNRILIIDGNNLLFQMFYGMPARIYSPDGVGIWGVMGFVGALLKMIRQTNPTHMVVLFDGENENERALIDTDYKANRLDYNNVKDEENPYSQLPHICQALDYLGIAYAETTECEADDWISSYARRYGNDNEIIISSFDSDFFQLINRNVSILRYRGDKSVICTPQYLQEKYGIEPYQYADFKSLVGDKADNIKGVEKVGVKTASALLREYDTLYQIIENAESIPKPVLRESIINSKERLLRNIKLIRLEEKNEIPFQFNQMAYTYSGITTSQVLQGIGLK